MRSRTEEEEDIDSSTIDILDTLDDEGNDVLEFGWENEPKKTGGRQKKVQKKAKVGTFDAMGLSPVVLKGIRRKGFRLPTPIQRKTIPIILQGGDVVGMARTGSGKTAAFVIPLLERLQSHSVTSTGARACILSPTRELALQTFKVVQDLGRFMNLRTAVLVGGDSMEAQFTELASSPDVIVATPGRLAHHLSEIEAFSMKCMEYVVFDEADRLFEMGFADQLKDIMSSMPSTRQTLLFSATMPRILAEFARAGLKDPELIRLDADSKVSPDLHMLFFSVRESDKLAALVFLLREVVQPAQSSILFAATRHHVEFLTSLLEKEKISVVPIHGAMDQAARKINLAKFKNKKAEVLIVTDVAARGIDIPLLDNVINYDFPAKPKLFVHRSGRVARAGRPGTSYNLITRDEMGYLLDLHLFLGKKLIPSPIRDLSTAEIAAREAPADPSISEFGCFPQTVLDPLVGHVSDVIAGNADLQIQLNSLNNSKKLYIKTRPPASAESARRAKAFEKEGIHPVLAAAVPSQALGGLEAQASLANITETLRSYRPSQTVFEAQVASARAGSGAGLAATPGVLAAAPYERNLEVMKLKREAHTTAIESKKKKRKILEDDKDEGVDDGIVDIDMPVSLSKGRFRDDNFYLSHEPSSGGRTAEQFLAVGSGDQFNDAIMDLGGEDADGEAKRKSSAWHWDTKAKRYVKLQDGETMKAGRRVKSNTKSSGKSKNDKKGLGIYERWTKKTKMLVGKASANEEAISKAMGSRFKRGGRGWENPLKPDVDPELKSRGKRNELKTPAEVRKKRKDDEKKKEKQLGKKKHKAQPAGRQRMGKGRRPTSTPKGKGPKRR